MFRLLAGLGCVCALGFSSVSSASSQCAGITYGGTYVHVSVRTVGAMGSPERAEVMITAKNGPAYGYALEGDEIVQFFETETRSRAIVGLAGFAELNFPVSIRYVGANYAGGLRRVLTDRKRRRQSGNEMRVWMGPGHEWSQQFRFTDIVCQVELNP